MFHPPPPLPSICLLLLANPAQPLPFVGHYHLSLRLFCPNMQTAPHPNNARCTKKQNVGPFWETDLIWLCMSPNIFGRWSSIWMEGHSNDTWTPLQTGDQPFRWMDSRLVRVGSVKPSEDISQFSWTSETFLISREAGGVPAKSCYNAVVIAAKHCAKWIQLQFCS